MNHIITRISDGLVVQAWNAPHEPADIDAQLASMAAEHGGTTLDYQYQTVLDATYTDILTRRGAGKAVYLFMNQVSEAGPPTLTAVDLPNGDKQLVCDVGNVGYVGVVRWECTAPDGTTAHVSANAVAGIETWDITPGQIGDYTIRVTTAEYGFAEIVFEEG